MTTLAQRRAARQAVMGETRGGYRGRTDRGTSVTHSTPVVVVAGDQPPTVEGLGYWKTGFSNGSFRKTLYTPSTFHIEVGAAWLAQHAPEGE